MNPTKEELIRRMNALIWERLGKQGTYPGGYQPGMYQSLTNEEEKEFWEAIRSLISHYGDGGPKVNKKQALEHIKEVIKVWGDAGIEIATMMELDWLRSIGVEVEEEKSEKSNDEMLARIDRQIRDARMDETYPSKPEEEKHV